MGRVAALIQPETPIDLYAAGRLRRVSDTERLAVQVFLNRYPEYRRLSHDELVVMAETYLDDETATERAALEAEGVPADWRRIDDSKED